MVDKTVYFATGHRKESTARVRVIPGSGKMIINELLVKSTCNTVQIIFVFQQLH